MSTIVLSGAAGGIGSAIHDVLTAAGHTVIPLTRPDVNLSSPEAIAALRDKLEPFDWLVCAHGNIDTDGPEDLERTFIVNTYSLFWLSSALMPLMQRGMIVLTSSAGISANGFFPAYSSAKAAANTLMQALARSTPDRSFYAVAPGATNTPMRERVAHDAASKQSPRTVAEVIAKLISGSDKYRSGDVLLVKDEVTSVANRLS